MKTFKNKKDVFNYLKKFGKIVLVRGSTAKGRLKSFSDIDVEVYDKKKKCFYELIFVKRKLILISVNYYDFKEGGKIKLPQNVVVLRGEYNSNLMPDFKQDKYNSKEKTKRECQLLLDFFMKYLRSKDKKYLKSVQKRI